MNYTESVEYAQIVANIYPKSPIVFIFDIYPFNYTVDIMLYFNVAYNFILISDNFINRFYS